VSPLAQRITAEAHGQLHGPIRAVVGPAAIAGDLALHLKEQPLVLIDGRFDHSPWITPDVVWRCGAVELGHIATLAGGVLVGPEFPGLAWRVMRPAAGAPPCSR
jgi:hypothetical protein